MKYFIKASIFALYISLSSLITVFSYKYFSRDKFSIPKVDECYERVYLNADKSTTYEIRKVIKINPEDKYNAVTYVYNFLGEDGFEKGKWYYLELLCSESVNTFFADGVDFVTVHKTNCPW
jgi:hypothetical protein